MANLSLKRWVPYIPDIGDNRAQTAPLTLEVQTGLTRNELRAWGEAVAASKRPLAESAGKLSEDLAAGTITAEESNAKLMALIAEGDAATLAVLEQHVRLVGRHTIEGAAVESLGDYVRIISELAGADAMKELLKVVPHFNTVTEEDALFSERLSGGQASMLRRSAAKSDR